MTPGQAFSGFPEVTRAGLGRFLSARARGRRVSTWDHHGLQSPVGLAHSCRVGEGGGGNMCNSEIPTDEPKAFNQNSISQEQPGREALLNMLRAWILGVSILPAARAEPHCQLSRSCLG